MISEEFGDWEEARRRIDLLAIDKKANLVVIELKREDGGHMDLQAIRYASMVSLMTFEKATDAFKKYLKGLGKTDQDQDPRAMILEFLDWDEPVEFAQDVRVVLASSEFSKELTSSVLWLNDHNLDIRCVRLKPYSLDGRILVDVQQIIPLPEAADYQTKIRERIDERARRQRWDLPSVLEQLRQKVGVREFEIAQKIVDWMRKDGRSLAFGPGNIMGTVYPILRRKEKK